MESHLVLAALFSAFYASAASLVPWLAHHINGQQDLANLADVWAPKQDTSNFDSWTAPILTALKCAMPFCLQIMNA